MLLEIAQLPRSTFYYHSKRQDKEDKYVHAKAEISAIYHENKGRYGYRRVTDELHNLGVPLNHKTVQRLMKELGLICRVRMKKYRSYKGEKGTTADNELNREFRAEKPNQKWVTDVTEFHYYVGIEKHKVYLSAILDLYDRRIVAYCIGDSNNNHLVFETFDTAVKENPDAHPLFHSDRGFQYTNRVFHAKIEAVGMTQSMSRVAKCIDNGPMEGFWGIIKRERYYGKRFTDRESLIEMIEEYLSYYNNKRL